MYRFFGLLLVLCARLVGQKVVYARNGLQSKDAQKEIAALEPPYIVIANHSVFIDFALLAAALYPRRINFIVARKYFEHPLLSFFLKIAQAIPKNLFQSDSETVRLAFSVLAQGGITGLYPEGQIAIQGVANKPPESIAKLVKRAGVPVVAAKTTGASLRRPAWARYGKRGPVQTELSVILTAEQSRNLPLEEIERITFEGINADNFAAQRKSNASYRGKKRAEGLENILYRCPSCDAEFTLAARGNYIRCSRCGLAAEYGEDAHLHFVNIIQGSGASGRKSTLPAHIGEWYEAQRKHEKRQVARTGFVYRSAVRLQTGSLTESGILIFTATGYRYEGSKLVQEFPASAFQYVPYDSGSNFQFYYQNRRYDFYPEDPRFCAKAAIMAEALFALQAGNR